MTESVGHRRRRPRMSTIAAAAILTSIPSAQGLAAFAASSISRTAFVSDFGPFSSSPRPSSAGLGRRSLRMSSAVGAASLPLEDAGGVGSFWHSHPPSRLFLARVHLVERLFIANQTPSHAAHATTSGDGWSHGGNAAPSSGSKRRQLSARTAAASQRFASDLGKGALATWRRQWKIVLAVDVGLFALCELLCRCSPLLQSSLIQWGTAGFLSIAQGYEACIFGALWTPVRVMDGVVQAVMVVPALFMATSLLSKFGNLFSSGKGLNLLDTVNFENLSAGKLAAAIGVKVSSETSTAKFWLTWPLLYSSAKTFLSVPIFEELLFRFVLQGNLLHLAYRASQGSRREIRLDAGGRQPRIADQLAPWMKYGIRFVVALSFALLHTMNHAEALMSVDAAVRWSGVFGAAMQTSVTFLASWFVYSPVFEKYGFVAAVGAHLAWNALTSFNIIRVLALMHCTAFVVRAVRNRHKSNTEALA